ncbi:SDR family NAD(P)-dependent oxidoreductase [Flavisphingomonas formosensis]|uniref:SDR family NAD(P)-dependent oxidoreductase n=1 Tax=Flavisphingomonas formosensis TaxID=861534 RepID=UPI0012FC56D5|nr:SDR family oxidoreductase [Sphingomonas formosensis]
MRGLDGKVAVIAGAGGIGGETAARLASEGALVFLGDLDLASAEDHAGRVRTKGGTCVPFAYDQTDDASVKALMDAAAAQFGRIDFLHANAADLRTIFDDSDALSVGLDVFDQTISVNLRGMLSCTRHALPHILRSKGAIVYTSSTAAHAGEPVRPCYAMSKAGVTALMRHVASRWGKDGIRANAIAPGMIITERLAVTMAQSAQDEMLAGCRSPRLGRSADIAAMVAMLFSDDGAWINGQVIAVDGGSTLRP